MSLLDRIAAVRRGSAPTESRYTIEDYVQWLMGTLGGSFTFQGTQFPLGVNMTMPGSKTEPIGENFHGFVTNGLRANAVVATCELVRVQVFCQARFKFRSERTGELFGTTALAPLEIPWPGATTGDLLSRVLLDADFAGNGYAIVSDGEIVRLRPDWVDIVLEPRMTRVGRAGFRRVGYLYWEDGNRGGDATPFLVNEVAHFAPMPDPLAEYRGMAWLTPVIREVMGDQAYSTHKLRFLDNAATPNLAVSLAKEVGPDQFEEFVDLMDEKHKGVANAGKTLYLGGGADVTVVGADMRQLDFKVVQGAGETRIAAAAGVGAVIAQFSEGMQGSSLNAGNFGAARRRFADVTMRHLWQMVSGAFEPLVGAPRDSRLWYDARDIPFLQEDEADAADIRQKDAITLRNLVDAGFEADAAVAYLAGGGDLRQLRGKHSGLFSVQLQAPGSEQPAEPAAPDAPEGEAE